MNIIEINECLVTKNLLTNVTKTNEHSNITTFVRALNHRDYRVLPVKAEATITFNKETVWQLCEGDYARTGVVP